MAARQSKGGVAGRGMGWVTIVEKLVQDAHAEVAYLLMLANKE
jgi:hypothetical protein